MLAPHRALADQGLQLGVDIPELTPEPLDVLLNLGADSPHRQGKPLLFGQQHLEQLPAPRQPALQRLGELVRERPQLRPHGLGEVRQDRRVEGVRLGELPHGAREVSDLTGIDHHDRQGSCAESRHQRDLITSRGL